jgi:hypothetical protein
MRGCLLLVGGIILGGILALYLWRPASPPVPRGVTAPQGADLHVLLADAYVSRLVNSRLKASSLSVLHDVRISSDPPSTLIAHAHASVGPFSIPVDIEAVPVVQNGAIHIRISSSHVGPVPIPSAFTGILESSINDSLNLQGRRDITVVAASVKPQGLDVYANYGSP